MGLGSAEGFLITVMFILLPSGVWGWICLQKKPQCPTPPLPSTSQLRQPDLLPFLPSNAPSSFLPWELRSCYALPWTPWPSLHVAGAISPSRLRACIVSLENSPRSLYPEWLPFLLHPCLFSPFNSYLHRQWPPGLLSPSSSVSSQMVNSRRAGKCTCSDPFVSSELRTEPGTQ